jgi:predicted branched-subunit amino acid permease
MAGLILVSFIGWVSGTFLGAAAGQLLPKSLTDAMGIVLYGMFIAIIIPPSRKSKKVLTVVVIAAGISILFRYLITAVSGGFAVIISAVAASAAGALLFPVNDGEEDEK